MLGNAHNHNPNKPNKKTQRFSMWLLLCKRHLKKWTSYGSSGRSAKGKMTVHCASFYKVGGIWGLALTINSNFHDCHGEMGVIFLMSSNFQPEPGSEWIVGTCFKSPCVAAGNNELVSAYR